MKLEQENRKRIGSCWTVLMAAMLICGVTIVADAKEKTTRKNQRRVAAIQNSDESQERPKLTSRSYQAGDLIEMITSTLKLDEDRAKHFLSQHLQEMVAGPWDANERIGVDFDFRGDGQAFYYEPIAVDQPLCASVQWSGSKLVVRHTKKAHEQISRILDDHRAHGPDQIVIEMHFISGPPSVINSISSSWTLSPCKQSPNHDRESTLTPRLDRPFPDKDATPHTTARTFVEKNMPVLMEVLDESRRVEILRQIQANATVTAIQMPKVTFFNGQSAAVQDAVQRPFVVGVRDGQPQLQVVTSGLTIELRPLLRAGNRIWLDYELTLSDIRNVEEASTKTGDGTPITVQIPEVAKTQVDSSTELPLGMTLMIGGLESANKKAESQSMLVLIRASKVPTSDIAQSVTSQNLMFGVGIDSELGVTDDLKMFPVEPATAIRELDGWEIDQRYNLYQVPRLLVEANRCDRESVPSDAEVMRLLKRLVADKDGDVSTTTRAQMRNVRIVKEKLADYVDPPRIVPLVGPAQLHHSQYKCTVYFGKILDTPLNNVQVDDCIEIFYVDVTHFHNAESDTSATLRSNTANTATSQPKELADTPTERIERQLTTSITLQHNQTPLEEVLQSIAKNSDLNVHLDRRGLAAEGITEREPITINIKYPIRVSSALNLILDPLQLKYEIENEVVRITSKSASPNIYSVNYAVADLVVPVPKTVRLDKPKSITPQAVLPDFDSLIDLIQTTIEPQSWDKVGGPGSISSFEANLSLVISQTEEVHAQIEDVLLQLRRLQDVNITCELRTIRVSKRNFNEMFSDSRDAESAILNDKEMSSLLQFLDEHDKIKSYGTPQVTLFNGQILDTPLDYSQTSKSAFAKRLYMTPVVSSDRLTVRLNLATAANLDEAAEDSNTFSVKDGHTLLMDVTDRLLPSNDESTGAKAKAKKKNGPRTLVLITPKINIIEEEEELLIPAGSIED